MTGLDQRVFLWINGLAGRSAFVDGVFSFLVSDYFVIVSLSLMLLVMWFAGETAERRMQLQMGVLWSAAGIGIANAVVKLSNLYWIMTPRPFDVLPTTLLFYQPTDSSFPSNSAAVAFAAAFGMLFVSRKAGLFAIVAAFLFAFSRVYAGVHFPSDVLGGLAIGFLSSLAMCFAFKWLSWLPRGLIAVLRTLRLA